MTEDMLTLELVNIVRKLSGHDILDSLPKGKVGDSNNCSVANAFKDIEPAVHVYKEGIFSTNLEFVELLAKSFGYKHSYISWKQPGSYRYGIPTPLPMGYFIEDFDKGCYPELVTD